MGALTASFIAVLCILLTTSDRDLLLSTDLADGEPFWLQRL